MTNKNTQEALVHLLQKGCFSVPALLLTQYKRVGLCEEEVLLLMQVMNFKEKEDNLFPTVAQLSARMTVTSERITNLLQKLVQNRFLQIEEEVDPQGLRCESYCINPLMEQLVASFLSEELEEKASSAEDHQLFQLFEQEFGRALSPIECEAITQWIDEDQYKPELIEAALREAVFSGKTNIRYIDRILLEWQKNGILSTEEATRYSRKFRKKGTLYTADANAATSSTDQASSGFSFYNWINR